MTGHDRARVGRRDSGQDRCRAIGPVLGQEQFLERGLAAEQSAHAGTGQGLDERLDRPLDLKMDMAAVHHGSLHARHPGQVGGHAIERGLDGQRRQMPHLGQRPHLDQATLAQDAHPVAQGLDLTQDVRRQEHRLPGIARLGHAVAERLLHERVEPAGGLVEHEQVGARHQGGDEQYLLLVALGVGPHLLRRVEIEALDQLVAVRGVDPALDPPQEVNRLERR